MSRTALIRPAWTPATIAMMVIGFMIFWPLGLAMLAYILWGDRLEEFKSEVNRATDRFSAWGRGGHGGPAYRSRTGNVAFDEWRETELTRLEEERRKLDETLSDFDEYLRELRRAKDSEEFESFMAARSRRTGSGGSPGDGPAPRSVPEI